MRPPSKLGTILIGGGTGFIGSSLVEALTAAKANVMIISRNPGPKHLSWSDVSTGKIPHDTKAIINVAGLDIMELSKSRSTGFKEELVSSRVQTTMSLRNAILNMQSPPRVFAHISGVGFYPYSETETYDEYSNGGDGDFFSRLTKDWENASILPDGHPTRRVVIRSGVVIGKRGGIIQRVYVPFFLGLGGQIGWKGSQFFPWISLQDLIRMFMFALQEDHVDGILNGVSPQIITNREFAKSLAKAMNRPALFPVPDQVISLVFGQERAAVLLRGMRVLPKRVQELGFTYDLPDIVQACRHAVTSN